MDVPCSLTIVFFSLVRIRDSIQSRKVTLRTTIRYQADGGPTIQSRVMFVWYLTSALRNRERSPKSQDHAVGKGKRQAEEETDTHTYMRTQVSSLPANQANQPASVLCHCASRGDRRTFCPHFDADLNQGKPHKKSRGNAALALLCFAWMEEEGEEDGGPSRIHCGWTWQLRERPPRKEQALTSAA